MKNGKKQPEKTNEPSLKERFFGLRGKLRNVATGCRKRATQLVSDSQRESLVLQGKAQAFEEIATELDGYFKSEKKEAAKPKPAGK